jgi:hypothetical protein
MRAPTTKERTISFITSVLAIGIGLLAPNAAAQSDPYPKMAPVDQYLMERSAEIQLARSAAPDSISRDARFRFWDGRATRQRSKAGTVLSASWVEVGRECLTGPNSGVRR